MTDRTYTDPSVLADIAPVRRSLPRWPLLLVALPAAVAVWSGWVGLGSMCGFGIIHPLPGIWDSFKLNTAITLPVGVEAYGAYALAAWMHPGTSDLVKRFARNSAFGSLGLGMGGQVIYHLLSAWHKTAAPWEVVMLVSCLPVVTLGFGTALTHLLAADRGQVPAAAPDALADPHADSIADSNAVPGTDSAPAIEAGTAADTGADSAPDTAGDSERDASPAPKRTAPRTRRGPSTADRVARMRDKHPDESPAEIAKRLNLHPRTVRRHLPKTADDHAETRQLIPA